jgi:hypothetical protein
LKESVRRPAPPSGRPSGLISAGLAFSGLLFFFAVLSAGDFLRAQTSRPDTIRALKIETGIKLDGVLDEPGWAKAQHISNFTQRELDEGSAATERTEVAVLYTPTDLYLGIWCYDSDPSRIVAQKMKWDFDYSTEDNFEIVLDTYADRRNAYFFAVNPNGSQADSLIMDNGREVNSDWNGVWHVSTVRTDAGWFAEIQIPFSTLKFSPAAEQTWKVNFERNILRKREQDLWQGWSRDASLRQISRAGSLVGLRGLAGLNVFEFRPYALGGAEKDRGMTGKTTGDLGLDFSYLVNPTVKMDFTVHPDFAQVESDTLIVNLTRFSISYPEKRQFFLEAQNFFDFPLGRARAFYSRRIGISDGEQTPILGGARFLGKMGGSTLGVMSLETARTDASPATNFSLVRWKQDVGEESSVGVLAIGEIQPGRFNGTGGVDALYSTSKLFGDKILQVGGALAATYTSDRAEKAGSAHRLFLSYPNDIVQFDASWERVGQDFNPEAGFLSRPSYQVFSTEFSLNPRPKFMPWVQQMEFKPLELDYYLDGVTREMQSVYMEFRPLGLQTKSGEAFEFNIQRNAENLTEDFEIREGHVIPAGRYWSNRGEIQFETFEGRPVVAAGGVNWGRFYDGTSTEWEAQAAWKPNRFASLSVSYQRGDIRLPADGFTIDEVGARLNFSLTPKLFGFVYAQWNNDDNEIRFNFRVTWIPKPGAALYFVLNEFGDTLTSRWRLNTTVAMVKFVWYLSTR